MKISRRDFIKACGASAALASVGATIAPPHLASKTNATPIYPKTDTAILIDITRCVGCRSCEQACKIANQLPDDNPVALSATTLTFVDFHNTSNVREKPDIRPVKRQCMQCQDPACVSVCPVGALYKKDNGWVGYDENVCIGCRYCMMACPFGVPKYNWDSANPKINKCSQGCMADGKRTTPACVEACPNQALYYGKRDDLLAIAKDRITKNPDKYVNKVYGEKEIGGTGALYLSALPFEQLGFRTDLPFESLPALTWNAQSKIPTVIGVAVTLLSGIAWWTHRSEKQKLVEAPVKVSHS